MPVSEREREGGGRLKGREERKRKKETDRQSGRSYSLIALISVILVVRVILSLVLTLKVSANSSPDLQSDTGNFMSTEFMGSDICASWWCVVGFSLPVSSQLFEL